MSSPVELLWDCDACPLMRLTRRAPVYPRGPEDARVMVVGQGPGKTEDVQGAPFVGTSGKWLANLLRLHALIDPDTVYYTNTTKCYPGRKGESKWLREYGTRRGFRPTQKGDRKPGKKECTNCTTRWLYPEIRHVQPEIIVTVGEPALTALLPNEKLSHVHGQFLPYSLTEPCGCEDEDACEHPDAQVTVHSCVVVPMYHPAFAAYSPDIRVTLINDFRKLADMWPPPEWTVEPDVVWADRAGFAFDFETTTPELGDKFAPTLAYPIGVATATEVPDDPS